MVAVAILAILVSIGVPSYRSFIRKAEKATCLSQMRRLHTGFDSYLLENNHWPQMPRKAIDFEEAEFWGWWVKEMMAYGCAEEDWICPSDERRKESDDDYGSSYVPTLFDSHAFSPHRYPQPWLVERADFHGRGGHVMMADGSIHTQMDALVTGNR